MLFLSKYFVGSLVIVLILNTLTSVRSNEDEKLKLLSLMKETNMDSRYTIPDEDFISSHIYHASTNKIITQKPYPSWILIEETGDWTSPIGHMPTPTKEEIESGMYYDWDEDLYQSDNTLGWVLIPLA